jgi:hypothetical protein
VDTQLTVGVLLDGTLFSTYASTSAYLVPLIVLRLFSCVRVSLEDLNLAPLNLLQGLQQQLLKVLGILLRHICIT